VIKKKKKKKKKKDEGVEEVSNTIDHSKPQQIAIMQQ